MAKFYDSKGKEITKVEYKVIRNALNFYGGQTGTENANYYKIGNEYFVQRRNFLTMDYSYNQSGFQKISKEMYDKAPSYSREVSPEYESYQISISKAMNVLSKKEGSGISTTKPENRTALNSNTQSRGIGSTSTSGTGK